MSEFVNGAIFGGVFVLVIEVVSLWVVMLMMGDDFPSVEEENTAYWLRQHEEEDQ